MAIEHEGRAATLLFSLMSLGLGGACAEKAAPCGPSGWDRLWENVRGVIEAERWTPPPKPIDAGAKGEVDLRPVLLDHRIRHLESLAHGGEMSVATLYWLSLCDHDAPISLDCSNRNLNGADFNRVNFPAKTKFNDSDLQGAKFNSATCHGCYFNRADLQGAEFIESTMPDAHFPDATLYYTNFSDATLYDADFCDAQWDESTIWFDAILPGTEFCWKDPPDPDAWLPPEPPVE